MTIEKVYQQQLCCESLVVSEYKGVKLATRKGEGCVFRGGFPRIQYARADSQVVLCRRWIHTSDRHKHRKPGTMHKWQPEGG
jgi:hypothetical protein